MSRDQPKARAKSGAPVGLINPHDNSASVQGDESVVKPKLPKMVLPKFGGEITEFRGFWDRFESAVHNNLRLTNSPTCTPCLKEQQREAYKAVA